MAELCNIHENVVPADFDRIALNPNGRIHGEFARSYVILPAVPGTGYDLAVKLAGPKRAATM